ncbi:hypothetical protein HPB50_012442 [Hyalomma asiaticum]|uniref:Uncharacterized protein n=1 Tax=Hyalomma asiaticum TaxID=266040 RepID=A0ACB7RVV1_HYAAI|nr:hypothetical protein HPB50_012442 [Hyalomma asiaticum]
MWLCSTALTYHRMLVLRFAYSGLITHGRRPWRLNARLLKHGEILQDLGNLLNRSMQGRTDLDGRELDEVKEAVAECFKSWGKRRAREEDA